MNTESAITQKTNGSDPLATMGFTPNNLPQAIALADMLGKSGLVPRAIAGKPADILVVLLTGHEFGLAPMAALRLLSVIDGKAVIGGEAYAAVVQASPECEYLRCVESTDKKATFVTKKRGSSSETSLTWTIEQAAKAQLLHKDNWKKYPEAMLRWRCVSALAKLEYAHRFAGVYVPDEEDEIRATATGQNGQTVEAQVIESRSTADVLAERLKPTNGAEPAKAPSKAGTATVDVVKQPPKTLGELDELHRGLTSLEIVHDARRLAEEPAYAAAKAAELAKRRAEKSNVVPLKTAPPADPAHRDHQNTDKLPHQVADEKKADQGPVMHYGGDHKGKPIRSLEGPVILELMKLGNDKLKSLDEKKAAKVNQNLADLKTELERRELAMLAAEQKTQDAKSREPGDDID